MTPVGVRRPRHNSSRAREPGHDHRASGTSRATACDALRKNVRHDARIPTEVLHLGLLAQLRALAGLRHEGLCRGDLAVLCRVAAADLTVSSVSIMLQQVLV